MEFVSTQRYLRVAPRKLREVTFMVKNLKPTVAIEVLPHSSKRAKVYVVKALKTAVANATSKGVNSDDLSLKEIQVSEGPRLKRYRPGSRGAAKPYIRRMSHLRIVLETKTNAGKKPKVKSEKVETQVVKLKKGNK